MTSIICLFELVHLNDLPFDKLVDDVVFVTPLTIAKTVQKSFLTVTWGLFYSYNLAIHLPNFAYISPIYHPYIIKIKAIFQPFELGENLKIQTPPHLKVVHILNC